MYTVAVEREFIARHFLFGGDWGDENNLHTHHYRLEVQLEGKSLNEHGYLIDINDIETFLNEQIDHYRESTLNSLPEFSGLNPSIEQLARILCENLTNRLHKPGLSSVKVRIWENRIAWASYKEEMECE